MVPIGFQQVKIFVRQLLNGCGKGMIAGPKIGRGEMLHKGVQRPASKSSSALRAK
jgi:hypothetical protein